MSEIKTLLRVPTKEDMAGITVFDPEHVEWDPVTKQPKLHIEAGLQSISDDCVRCPAAFIADNLCIGYVLAVYAQESGDLMIGRVCVHPDFRRMSVASQLVSCYTEDVREAIPDIKRVLTAVPEKNLVAQLFFKAMGFEATSIMEFCNDADEVEEIMYGMRHIP